MSSSANRRIYRAPEAEDDVFVVGEGVRRHVPADATVSTVTGLMDGARRKAEMLIAAAETRAAEIVMQSEAEASAIRAGAVQAGHDDGAREAESMAASHLAQLRAAAGEGLAIREAMIDEAMPAIARAVAMACRRLVGGAFEADPSLTAEVCAEAARAAAGQQILSIRVAPEAAGGVRAALVDLADYVLPDEAVSLGGCIIDLRNGTIDATLEARLSLMELALLAAGGGAE